MPEANRAFRGATLAFARFKGVSYNLGCRLAMPGERLAAHFKLSVAAAGPSAVLGCSGFGVRDFHSRTEVHLCRAVSF